MLWPLGTSTVHNDSGWKEYAPGTTSSVTELDNRTSCGMGRPSKELPSACGSSGVRLNAKPMSSSSEERPSRDKTRK